MKYLYFERNENLVKYAEETLKRIFLFSGASDVNQFNKKRCLNEIGNLIDLIQEKKPIKNVAPVGVRVDVLKNKDVKISPTIVIQKKSQHNGNKPISVFFDEYKKTYGLEDRDFGIGVRNPRTREYVFNKVMFSRYAFGYGYKHSEISSLLRLDRTTIIYYINEYKDRNYEYEEQNTGTIG
jgi:hypothetical protein